MRIIFFAHPLAFDYPFVNYYLDFSADDNPFCFTGIDIRGFAMGLWGKSYRESGKGYLPKRLFDNLSHNLIAFDDAIEQGASFCNMLAEHGSQNK